MVKFWYPDRDYKYKKDIYDRVLQDVLSRGDLILRSDVEKFERNFARFVGTRFCVAVASGTDALELTLRALGVGKGDEVITTSYTFRATAEAIKHTGATPILADIDEDWKDYITERTKAVIPAHLEGKLMDWKPDRDHPEIKMIEDSCQALGAGKMKGIAACYSFYPAKILGCFGDGGAVATDDNELAFELQKMRNHYKGYWGENYGFNSRLDNIQAAILNMKLEDVGWAIQRRKAIASIYDAELKDTPLTLPEPREVYQDYIVEGSALNIPALQNFLQENEVESIINEYPFPDSLPKKPKAWAYEKRTLRLPCTPHHTDQEIGEVINGVKAFFGQWKHD